MKKLLLVLLVVTLASFLFVGCLPTTPTEGEGEGEGEAEPAVTVAIGDSVVLVGKTGKSPFWLFHLLLIDSHGLRS